VLSGSIAHSANIIGRRDLVSTRVRLALLRAQADIVVGLDVSSSLCIDGVEGADRLTNLADVARGRLIWITSFRGVLSRFIWALLDPVLPCSVSVALARNNTSLHRAVGIFCKCIRPAPGARLEVRFVSSASRLTYPISSFS
jgi:hypothetical protein